MTVEAYVTTASPSESSSIRVEDGELLRTLGPEEEQIALRLQDLLESLTTAIAPKITATSQLTIELTGSVTMKAQGGLKYLFFNVGGERGNADTMKLTLNTTLQPKGNGET